MCAQLNNPRCHDGYPTKYFFKTHSYLGRKGSENWPTKAEAAATPPAKFFSSEIGGRSNSHAFDRLRIEHERAGRYGAAGQTDTGFGVADRSEIADVSGKNAHRASLALADATAARELDPVAFAEIQQRAVGGAPCKGRAGPVEPNLVALIGKDGGRGVGVDTNDSEKISNFGTPRTIKPRVTSRRMAGGPQR